MAIRSMAGMMAAAMVLMAVPRDGRAQPVNASLGAAAADAERGRKTGILTDRLSGKQLRIWKSIEKIAFARDESGRLLHPTLHGLWQQAEECGHPIYIEMPRPMGDSPYTAGRFLVEGFDPRDQSPVGVVRLYLEAIVNASTSGRTRRPNGFMPFEGLRQKDLRYAEVLGHELVHALLTLKDPNHARLCREMESQVAAMAQIRRVRNGEPLDEKTRELLTSVQALSEEIERQAEAVEVEIWRELAGEASDRRRGRSAR